MSEESQESLDELTSELDIISNDLDAEDYKEFLADLYSEIAVRLQILEEKGN